MSGRTLAAGASCSVKVTFSAQGAGARSASLAFPTDPPNAIVVTLHGVGAAPMVAEAPRPIEKAPEAQPPPRPVTPIPPPERRPEIPVAAPRILSFEAKVGDGKVQLCYGVENAASATISPSLGAVKPLAKECVPVAAGAARTYTLTARNSAGAAVTRALTIEAPATPPPMQLVTVPNAIGKSRAEAVAELEKAGLEARIVEDKLDPQASGPVGAVVAQLPKAGEQLKTGGRVTLQIMPAPAPVPPPAAVASSALPRAGDVWEYRFRSMWRNVEPRTYAHQAIAVSDREVRETMSYTSGGEKSLESKSFNPDTRFVEWRGKGYYYVEFNPFIGAFGGLKPGTAFKSLPIPVDDPFFGNWSTNGRVMDWDSVTVPAGTFKAIRVEINSHRAPTASVAMRASEPVRILNVIWFAPDVKRAVKLVRTVYSTSGTRLDEETYELVKYRVQ
jgi:PASTA domain